MDAAGGGRDGGPGGPGALIIVPEGPYSKWLPLLELNDRFYANPRSMREAGNPEQDAIVCCIDYANVIQKDWNHIRDVKGATGYNWRGPFKDDSELDHIPEVRRIEKTGHLYRKYLPVEVDGEGNANAETWIEFGPGYVRAHAFDSTTSMMGISILFSRAEEGWTVELEIEIQDAVPESDLLASPLETAIAVIGEDDEEEMPSRIAEILANRPAVLDVERKEEGFALRIDPKAMDSELTYIH